MNLDELLSGYLSLTGRPAATLSVSEYLEFVKVTEERGYHSSYQGKSVNDVSKTESISTENIPNKKENYPAQKAYIEPKIHEEPIEEQDDKAYASSYQVRTEVKPHAPLNNSLPRTNTQQTSKKTNVLAMLQSVSG